MKTFFKFSGCLIFSFLYFNICAQVKTKIFDGEIPKNLLPSKNSIWKSVNVNPRTDFDKLKAEAKINDNAGDDNKFALFSEVNIDVLKDGFLQEKNEMSFYFINIKTPSALNISLIFNQFHLAKNAVLSIFTKHELTDSITSKQNNQNNAWSSRTYQGKEVNLVLQVPTKERNLCILNIKGIYLGFKPFGASSMFGDIGASDKCMINIACPIGSGWEKEKNAVALVNANGSYGTGTLVMNTCGTNIPYFLTARHGLDAHESTWSFQFLFYSTDCNANLGYREDLYFSGATVKSFYDVSDFALLQFNEVPPANSGLYYAGWDNRIFSYKNKTTMLHHPKGDVMKISLDNNSPQYITWYGMEVWKLGWEYGGSQGGSSGAPFFDQNHRIIGQMFGVETIHAKDPCFPDAYGGRFDVSWTGGGTNATRLSNWLDPSNSGAMTTNTTNVSALFQSASAMSISGPDFLCSSAFYTLQGVPAGTPITWSVSNPNFATVTSSGYVTAIWAVGSFSLTATIHDNCGNPTNVDKTVSIGAPNISSYKVIGPGTVYSNAGYYYSVSSIGVPHPVNIYWSVPSGWTITNGQGTESISVWTGSAGGIVAIDFDNFCGEPTGTYKTVVIGTGGGVPQFTGDGINTLKLTPNPANSNVIVSLLANTTKMNSGSNSVITEIKIIDKVGTVRKRFTFNNRSASQLIDISGLPVDTYVIQAFTGTQWLSSKLLIVNN